MTVVEKYAPGTFCWADVMTSDTEAGKQFYTQLFGWTSEDMPTPQGPVYTMFSIDGRTVCALAPMPPGEQMPPHWNAYIATDDVDATVTKANELGGTVVMPAMDVMTAGRMAFIQDPTGAIVGYWQANEHIGAELAGGIEGTIVWDELMTRDVEGARQFYTGLLGWSADTQQVGEIEYTSFMDGETPRGGLMAMPPEMPDFVPPNWLVYFATDDTDALAARVKELGGVIQVEPQDIPGIGRFTVAADPQGAVFAAIKLIPPSS